MSKIVSILIVLFLVIKVAKSQFSCNGKFVGKNGGKIDWTRLPVSTADSVVCSWNVTVKEGNVIEFYFHYSEFPACTAADCTFSSATCKSNLRVSELPLSSSSSSSVTSEGNSLFCKTKLPPEVLVTTSNKCTLTLTRDVGSLAPVFITWKAKPASLQCCNKVLAKSDDANAQFSTDDNLKTWLGTYTVHPRLTTGDGLYPVYVKDDNRERWLSHMETGYVRPWRLTTSDFDVGGNSGFMFFGPEGVCPPSVVVASAYDFLKSDGSFGKEDKRVSFQCATECKEPPPPTPQNTLLLGLLPISPKKGDILTYTCKQHPTFRIYSRCQGDGKWSQLAGVCPAPPMAPWPVLLPGRPVRLLNSESRCALVMTDGWPRKAYNSGMLTWRFKAGRECASMVVSFDQDNFDIRGHSSPSGLRHCAVGDRLSIFVDAYERKKTCGGVAPNLAIDIDNDGQTENRIELRADDEDFGSGFMAEVCAVGCDPEYVPVEEPYLPPYHGGGGSSGGHSGHIGYPPIRLG